MNADGQLYTIEGVAASALILTTVYLVLSTTTVLTPGETHIYDMQLEQLGNDVLATMDLNQTWGEGGHKYPKSPLEQYIENDDGPGFGAQFLNLSNQVVVGRTDDLKFTSNIIFRNATGVHPYYFNKTHDYNRERAVMVTRWVNIDNTGGSITGIPGIEKRQQTVLLEVLLWRD